MQTLGIVIAAWLVAFILCALVLWRGVAAETRNTERRRQAAERHPSRRKPAGRCDCGRFPMAGGLLSVSEPNGVRHTARSCVAD